MAKSAEVPISARLEMVADFLAECAANGETFSPEAIRQLSDIAYKLAVDAVMQERAEATPPEVIEDDTVVMFPGRAANAPPA